MLSKKEEIKAFALINFYEYSSGIILGTLTNFIYRYLFPYHENESVIKSVPLLFLLVITIVTLVLYLRKHVVYTLPILKDMDLDLWRTIFQFKIYFCNRGFGFTMNVPH